MAKSIVDSSSLIRCDSEELDGDLIGAAVFINEDKIIEHAALFIRYGDTHQIFHYDGTAILIDSVIEGEWYFFKEIMYIHPEEVPIVLAHCELVKEFAKVRYGFFYNGTGLFDSVTGDYLDETGLPERMSCVGFCLNFLKSYLRHEFFHFEDWDIYDNQQQGHFDDDYIANFIEKAKRYHTNVTEEELMAGIRRILPVEYITGGFSKDLPVRKDFTDRYHPVVQDILLANIA